MGQLFKYVKLFDVRIAHNYYTSGFSGDFVIKPSVECQIILNRTGWVFKPTASGFEIYAPVKPKDEGHENDPWKIKASLNEDLQLTFFMYLNNSCFDNFTDLPLTKESGAMLYFSNLSAYPAGRLHLQETAGKDEYIKIYKGIYNYQRTLDTDKTQLLEIYQRKKSILAEEKSVTSAGKIINHQFDLRKFPQGVYELRVDGDIADTFYLTRDLETGGAYGILDIFTTVPDDNKFILPDDSVTPKSYVIAFGNRKTYWRYKISNNKNIPLTEPFIEWQNDATLFNTHPAGSLNFVSKDLWAIKEEPVQEIKLKKKVNGLNVTVRDNLPNAAIHQILPEKENNQIKIYSDIFIYL